MPWLSLLFGGILLFAFVAAFSRGRTRSDHAAEAYMKKLPFIPLRDSYFPSLRTYFQPITGIGDAVSKGYSNVCRPWFWFGWSGRLKLTD